CRKVADLLVRAGGIGVAERMRQVLDAEPSDAPLARQPHERRKLADVPSHCDEDQRELRTLRAQDPCDVDQVAHVRGHPLEARAVADALVRRRGGAVDRHVKPSESRPYETLRAAAREQGGVRVEAHPAASCGRVLDHLDEGRREKRLAEYLERDDRQLGKPVDEVLERLEREPGALPIERRAIAHEAHATPQIAGAGHLDLDLARQRRRRRRHAATSWRSRSRSAATTASAVSRSKPGSTRAAFGAPAIPAHSTRCFARSGGGPHRSGAVGPKRRTDGVPTAVARCATPVSPHTTRAAAFTNRASPRRSVAPASTALVGSAARAAISRAIGASSAEPVSTTRLPTRTSARATAAQRCAGHCRAVCRAPGWISVAPTAPPGTGPAGTSRSSLEASAAMPSSRNSRHQRVTSCSSARHTGDPALSAMAGCAKAISRRGASRRRTRWLSGPRPCRLTPTSIALRESQEIGASGAASMTSSTAPERSARGASARGIARTRRWRGNASASARNAGKA